MERERVSRFLLVNVIGVRSPDDDAMMQCPKCGSEFVHFDGEPFIEHGFDRGAADHHIGNRGDCCVVPLVCESGHAWNFVMGFHKGNIFMNVRDMRDTARFPQ